MTPEEHEDYLRGLRDKAAKNENLEDEVSPDLHALHALRVAYVSRIYASSYATALFL
jgi:hypothetical protein